MVQLDNSLLATVGKGALLFLIGGVVGIWGASSILMPKIKRANDTLNRQLGEKAKERQK